MLGAAVPVSASYFKTLQQQRLARIDIGVVPGIHPYLPRLRHHHRHRCPNGKSVAAQVSGIAQLEHVRQQLSSSTTSRWGMQLCVIAQF